MMRHTIDSDLLLLGTNQMKIRNNMSSVNDAEYQKAIKKAYKLAAIKCHPDKGGDSEKMKKINAAFDRLKTVKMTPPVERVVVVNLSPMWGWGSSTTSSTTFGW